jgi:uncharacterized protein YjbJ (UPF0337 family)
MTGMDKIKNRLDEMKGFAKERIGGITGNTRMRAQGKNAQSKSNLKQAGEKIKDVFK